MGLLIENLCRTVDGAHYALPMNRAAIFPISPINLTLYFQPLSLTPSFLLLVWEALI